MGVDVVVDFILDGLLQGAASAFAGELFEERKRGSRSVQPG
jgi:hypothetical protein